MRDRLEREQVKRRAHRDRGEPNGAGEKFTVDFCGPFRPRRRREKQRLKSGEHGHDNKDFVSGEIFFGNKERRDPGELHQRSSNRAQDGEHIPALSLPDSEQTDVEQRDVHEKSERMILAR